MKKNKLGDRLEWPFFKTTIIFVTNKNVNDDKE